MDKRPVIGIQVSPPEAGSPYYNLNPQYTDAIWAAGGMPLVFPLIPEAEYADFIITQIDGIITTGCAYDIDPARYGQKSHQAQKPPNNSRDDFDWLLFQRAFEHQLPVMGICHGAQTINVIKGGTLYQNIPSMVQDAVVHRAPSGTGEYVHEVVFTPGSSLNPTNRSIQHPTNSAHDQAVHRLGTGLRVIGRTTDGLVEAYESDNMARQFILGIQWHPERLAPTDKLSFQTFRLTIEAAARWRTANRP